MSEYSEFCGALLNRKLKTLAQSTRKFRNKISLRQLYVMRDVTFHRDSQKENFCAVRLLLYNFFPLLFSSQMRLHAHPESREYLLFHRTHSKELACRWTVNPPSMCKTCIKFCKQSISPEEASIIHPVNLDDV